MCHEPLVDTSRWPRAIIRNIRPMPYIHAIMREITHVDEVDPKFATILATKYNTVVQKHRLNKLLVCQQSPPHSHDVPKGGITQLDTRYMGNQ